MLKSQGKVGSNIEKLPIFHLSPIRYQYIEKADV